MSDPKINIPPPSLPIAPDEYDRGWQESLLKILRIYFVRNSVQQDFAVRTLNFDVNSLPTQTSLTTLRVGDVYRDSSAGDVLKIKV
jgi:hypothetical protein